MKDWIDEGTITVYTLWERHLRA